MRVEQISLGFKNGLQLCLVMDVEFIPLKIRVYYLFAYRLCLKFCEVCIKLGFTKICFPFPCDLIFCPDITFDIWKWQMDTMRFLVFAICNFPPDSTPPVLADAFVDGQQTDAETMAVSWGGARDAESNVHGYTACIGTQPGGQDIAACQDAELDRSLQFNLLEFAGKDQWVVFVAVLVRNGEELESVLIDRVVIDDSGPTVVDFMTRRYHDGAYVDEPIVKHSEVRSIELLLSVVEENPEENVQVSMVETAVGLGPESYQDAAEWSEVTAEWAKKGYFVPVPITGLDLQHGVEYYVHVRTTNTIGRQAVTTSPTKIFVDLTPAIGQYVNTHNGASVMMEYRLEWRRMDEGNPEFSATYWQVGSTWAFYDPESEIARWEVSVLDANGDPDNALGTEKLEVEEDTVLIEELDMPHLFQYEVRVRCLTVANLWSEMISPPVTIDRTRPNTRQVLDLDAEPTEGILARVSSPESLLGRGFREPELLAPSDIIEVELDFVTALSELRVGFAAWDEDSGISLVQVAVGVAPGSTSIMDWTPVDHVGKRHVAVQLPDGTSLVRHLRYYVSVSSVNVRVAVLRCVEGCVSA